MVGHSPTSARKVLKTVGVRAAHSTHQAVGTWTSARARQVRQSLLALLPCGRPVIHAHELQVCSEEHGETVMCGCRRGQDSAATRAAPRQHPPAAPSAAGLPTSLLPALPAIWASAAAARATASAMAASHPIWLPVHVPTPALYCPPPPTGADTAE